MNSLLPLETDAAGKMMNIGSKKHITIADLVGYVVGVKRSDARHGQSDVFQARELIDYEPSTTAREGVAKCIEW